MPDEDVKQFELTEAQCDLLAAADYIEKHGWCKNNLTTPDGRVCALGAIASVIETKSLNNLTNYSDRTMRAVEYFSGRLIVPFRFRPDNHLFSISAWNDWMVTTKQDVLDALRAAAKTKGD